LVSNHVLRAAPKKGSVPAGYIVTALTHPLFGRPIVKALAFGSSVPEIDGDDLAQIQIVRLKPAEESAIAEAAERSAKVRAAADLLEREITADAEKLIANFMAE
jgi:type I restriction enzyme S subunit